MSLRQNLLYIDMNKRNYQFTKCMQHDNNIPFTAHILKNGLDANLMGYEVVAYIRTSKGCYQRNCSIDNSQITFILDNKILSAYGDAYVEFTLYKNKVEESTFTIKFSIDTSIKGISVEEIPDWDIVKKMLDFNNTTLIPNLNDMRNQVTDLIDKFQNQFDNLSPDQQSNVEVQLARGEFESLSERLTDSDSKLDALISKNFQTMKLKKYRVGDIIKSNLYSGSTWIVKDKSDIKFQKDYILNFDDELHVSVPLKGGGIGIAECQISSIIEYAKEQNTKGLLKYYSNLNNHELTKVACYGDSLTFGQYDGEGSRTMIDTNNNQDVIRVHKHNQLANPYPAVLENTINSVYGLYGRFCTVENKGYSGDTISDCYMHCTLNHNYDIALFQFAVNDASLCTDGGKNQAEITNSNNNNNIFITVDVYRKLLVREMLRGSGVIVMLPHRYYNFNHYMSTKKFCSAFRKLFNELHLLCVEWNDLIADYEIHQITHDNIHLNSFGAEVIGKRIASVLIGNGYDEVEKIVGERQLTASKMKDNIITYSGSFETSNLYSPSFYANNSGDDILLLKNKPLYYIFYLEEDKKCLMPIGRIQGQNGSITYSLNFNTKQPEFKLDIEKNDIFTDNGQGGLTTLKKAPASSKTINNSELTLEFGSKYLNSIDDLSTHLCVQGKGWHTLEIKNNTDDIVLISGLRFFNAIVDIDKIDAY